MPLPSVQLISQAACKSQYQNPLATRWRSVQDKACSERKSQATESGEMDERKKVYRSDSRNAARSNGTLASWRNRPRIRSSLWGWRQDALPDGSRGEPYKVYTFVIGAA